MYWFAAKNVVVRVPNWRSLSLLIAPSLHLRHHPFSFSPPFLIKKCEQIRFFRGKRTLTKATKRVKHLTTDLEGKDLIHILWWKEKMQKCRKPSSLLMIQRLIYTNLLGLDANLRYGSLKEGTLNWEILMFKSKFPREVLLCRVGEFYEAIGFDACILVEYAGLNPFGGLKTDGIPKAGCPVVNLRQTLDDLTRNGFSVCIVEEIQGPTQARVRKSRFISGHAHPGSPYVFGLLADDCDLDFPEPMPVIGISRSAKGYCMVSVLETMKTYSAEDCLTEEALVVKLRTCQCHYLFLHGSLKNNTSGTCRWAEFGEGGLLWGECTTRLFEWFEGDPVNALLSKVKELYGIDSNVVFRDVTIPSENRPHPLHLGTATQIGAIPTEGIPCLLKVLLPSNCTGLPVLYVRDLLLNPPAYDIASKIQEACKHMANVTCSIPDFTCISSAKLVKLLELREANHIEFCRIKSVLDELLHMHGSTELNEILRSLIDPTWAATGLKVKLETLVDQCTEVSSRIGEIISIDVENDWKNRSYEYVPKEFVEDMESSWKCRVKKVHIEEVLAEVEKAAEDLALAVAEDFAPIVSRVKAMAAPFGGSKGEIVYAREYEAVWFKGKRFVPSVWGGTPGEEQIKQLIPALDSKGKKVGEEWFTTLKVQEALTRYHDANTKARMKVLELLRILSSELQTKINLLVFASMLLIIAKALFAHVSEGRRRKWVFPYLYRTGELEMDEVTGDGMKITGLSPYWLDAAQGNAVQNTVDMCSLFLLTGPNGGGKSSLLRSICAAAVLGICGFMVPAESAIIPHFDSIMLHMKAYDSPADGKSSFQVEMSEIRSIIASATSRSLVLIDEICRGTETAKGTCIAGSVIETLDGIGCLGIVSTHLHGIFDLPLATKKVVYKAMSAESVDGQTIPTCKLIDGISKESLAFETAEKEGVPSPVIRRAEALYLSVYKQDGRTNGNDYHLEHFTTTDHIRSLATEERCISSPSKSSKQMELVQKEVDKVVTEICQKTLTDLCKNKNVSNFPPVKCIPVAARQKPPPSTIGNSCVYLMFQPGDKLYVGETDDLDGRICTHRSKDGLRNASFLYIIVPGKSIACQLETLLINQLPTRGFNLTNVADGKHRNFGSCDLSLESAALL